jgi:hypothetical protein
MPAAASIAVDIPAVSTPAAGHNKIRLGGVAADIERSRCQAAIKNGEPTRNIDCST